MTRRFVAPSIDWDRFYGALDKLSKSFHDLTDAVRLHQHRKEVMAAVPGQVRCPVSDTDPTYHGRDIADFRCPFCGAVR